MARRPAPLPFPARLPSCAPAALRARRLTQTTPPSAAVPPPPQGNIAPGKDLFGSKELFAASQATRRAALLRQYLGASVALEDRAPLLVALSKELAELGIRPDDAMPG